MTSLDLNALLLFKAVVEAGSLSRATTATRLSVATISRRLTELERQVGSALLERTSRRLSPTPLGRAMLTHAARIAGEAQIAQDVATEMRAGVSGRLRLSLPVEFGQAWLGRAAAAFMVAHPDVVLDIQTNDGTVDFARDGCDLAVVLRTLPDSRMVRKRLGSLERGLFAAPSYLERLGTPRALDELGAHRCLITELQRDENTWELFHKRRMHSVKPEWHATVPNIGLLRELVLGGAGIGMLNDALVQSDLRNGRLVRLFPEWRGPPVTATAVIPGHRLITKRSRLFLDFISDYVRNPR